MKPDRRGAVVMIRAHLAGKVAARDGRPATDLPYDLDAEDAVTRAKARMWLCGYDRVNPMPIDWSS